MEPFERQLVVLAPRLRRHARGLTGDAMLADDLVQDTLERALRYRWRFRLRPGALWGDGADGLLPWLLTLMHRLRLKHLRKSDVVTARSLRPPPTTPDRGHPRDDKCRPAQALLAVRHGTLHQAAAVPAQVHTICGSSHTSLRQYCVMHNTT